MATIGKRIDQKQGLAYLTRMSRSLRERRTLQSKDKGPGGDSNTGGDGTLRLERRTTPVAAAGGGR